MWLSCSVMTVFLINDDCPLLLTLISSRPSPLESSLSFAKMHCRAEKCLERSLAFSTAVKVVSEVEWTPSLMIASFNRLASVFALSEVRLCASWLILDWIYVEVCLMKNSSSRLSARLNFPVQCFIETSCSCSWLRSFTSFAKELSSRGPNTPQNPSRMK